MCGIIAVLRCPATRSAPVADAVVAPIRRAVDLLGAGDPVDLAEAAGCLEEADSLLGGAPGLESLLGTGGLLDAVAEHLAAVHTQLASVESALEARIGDREAGNAALVRLRDAAWAISNDRLGAARGVSALSSTADPPSRFGQAVLLSVQQALSALDRLEVRGRDSAGLQVTLWDHGLDLSDPAIAALLATRTSDPLLRSGSARVLPGGGLALIVKTAAEIGELGDNTSALRRALVGDELLARALVGEAVRGSVLGHTRWASFGIIAEANAHPLDSTGSDVAAPGRFVSAVQNGDVDNHADLVVSERLDVPDAITTDAKVVPLLCARHLEAGESPDEAFRRAVRAFEGSLAIAASFGATPDRLHLSLRGSGQALYVGLAEDAFIVASEPYGVVELATHYVRMDGDVPAEMGNPATRGQLIELDGAAAGTLAGMRRRSFDGSDLPLGDDDLAWAGITTRDIDRGDHPHYLLKEISESPDSVRSTLRGRLLGDSDGLVVAMAPEVMSDSLRADLASGRISKVIVIGQGTAAIAGEAVAGAIGAELVGTGINVSSRPATELSGFGLQHDMADTLVVAISQSGTTTDTNRTVDLVRSRGGRVLAIVNRRNSDLTDRADGVLYTSDGRDVEMSVASTKAFYAQAVAGFLLGAALADAVGAPGAPDRSDLLAGLRSLPDAMAQVFAGREHIADLATRYAPARRYWAVVGNGANLVAAREIRIKLSELCYKAVAADTTEDKKHIDLSSEPLILVCATGLSGSTIDDVAKEVAIYRAHKAAPLVVTDAPRRYAEALDVVEVPVVHPRLAFVLATMVGHLFGYEAALAIDAQARPLREAHAAIEQAAAGELGGSFDEAAGGPGGDALVDAVRERLLPCAGRFHDELRSGRLNGHLEAATAVRLASLFRYALGDVPLESYQREFGRVGTPALVLDDLASALTAAIGELTRPVDAIKHQAKTVTVGISRTDETLLEARLTRALLDAGAPRDGLSYRTLRLLLALDPAVAEINGFTRYRLDGVDGSVPTAAIVDRGGVSTGIPSRTERDPALRGTKHGVAVDREVLVTRGARDGRTIVLVPEVKDAEVVGLTLLHVTTVDRLPSGTVRSVLEGYHNRYGEIRDAVCETEPSLRDDLLAAVAVEDLLTDEVGAIADRLRSRS